MELENTRYTVRMRQHSRHVHHSTHHLALSYPVSISQRIYTIVLGPLAVVAVSYVLINLFPLLAHPSGAQDSFETILWAALYTCVRLAIAYVFAVIVAIPLSILVTTNATVEAILLPVFDVLESVPILALFPVIIVLFVNFGFLNGAAIFMLFLTMLWNIVFTLVGGLKLIPTDVISAAKVFDVTGVSYVRRVVLPSLVPQLVTGSILAVAQGWNLIIVAEVLHTYIPNGTSAQDLFGVGSILVDAAAHAQNTVFIEAVLVMVVIIGLMNLLVWQRLLRYSQKFRFE